MKIGNTHRITNIRICLEFKRRFDTKIELEYKQVCSYINVFFSIYLCVRHCKKKQLDLSKFDVDFKRNSPKCI